MSWKMGEVGLWQSWGRQPFQLQVPRWECPWHVSGTAGEQCGGSFGGSDGGETEQSRDSSARASTLTEGKAIAPFSAEE